MYDYNNGRFLSVDPFIQEPSSTQSLNPYTYIFNNPLSGTDPTGYYGVTGSVCVDGLGCIGGGARDQERGKDENGLILIPLQNGSNNAGSFDNKLQNRSISNINDHGQRFKDFAKNFVKECGSGCPDHVKKAAKDLAEGQNQFPSDSILLPASADDNGTRVRLSPSENLIYWEAPDGTVTTQDIKQFGEVGLKNGLINTFLTLIGSVGTRGTSSNINTVGKTNVQSGRVQSRINIANSRTRFTPLRKTGQPVSAGFDHVLSGHFGKQVANNRSIFTIKPTELKSLLQSEVVVNSKVSSIGGGQFSRTVNVGKTIGRASLNQGGGVTSNLRVITDKGGNLITTYPVK